MFDRCLYFNVNALARVVNKKWAEGFEQFDLSPAHGYMLRAVLANPGVNQKELATSLKLEKSTITRFVDALQKKKLVIRKKSDGTDGREQNIYPTSKATKIYEDLEDLGNDLYKSMVSSFGKEKLTALVAQLREGAKNIK
jgi:DNA-binding MarR family transcriptional regulator